MVEEHDFSIITGLEGYDCEYSLSEFTEYLKADLSSEKLKYEWVFWRPDAYQQSEYELSHHSNSTSYKTAEIKEKIKRLLKDSGWGFGNVVQFWAPKVDGRHHYLTTSDQPFSVGFGLCKGPCWYRKKCIDHYYVVEEGAKEEQLGPVGRVYRNKHPESSPDLRLYSTNEFPLRDFAARCGLRAYLAVPVFDLLNNECNGVLELLSFNIAMLDYQPRSLDRGLQEAELRFAHIRSSPPKYEEQHWSEISKMLGLAIKAVPQLHLAQVWVRCKQCANISNNLTCMERAAFITTKDERVYFSVNGYNQREKFSEDWLDNTDMLNYLEACEFHILQIEKGIVSCVPRNLRELSISENPLAHYAQKARLSLCFALSLENVHNSNDLYVIEFFLQSNCREDACGGSFVHLLLRIMKMELKSYKFALGEQLGEELVVELSQPNAIEYESNGYTIEMEHQHSEEPSTLTVMERCGELCTVSDFSKYLGKDDLCCLKLSENHSGGWFICSLATEELSDVNNNSSLVNQIILLMCKIASKLFWDETNHYLAQFWAPKMEEGRCYLKTTEQPFALSCLGKGLASFRKRCMEHHYFVDEGAKEEEVGPPGRVFRNGHPELTPDLRLYSKTEFSLRNHAAHCRIRSYFALPVFDLLQHKCVGVLELVNISHSIFEDIGKALEAANLSSTHITFRTSFQSSHVPSSIPECRKLALTEVEEALKLVSEMPQLYRAEVWVPYGECATINSNLSCMELALSTMSRCEVDLRMCQIHVPTRKGIAGMVLASENKSCFCLNSCEFSIAEQPLAHYAQRERLDVCFAIGLQSSHTGNLLYVLEFFLNQGPATYEYLRSFLNFLVPIMKQKLKSFKVASGKQLGEELVVEVIEFSEANKLTLSELDQPDIFPVKFKIVQYDQKEHQHTKDQQVACVSDGLDSVTSVAQAKRRSTAAPSSKKEDSAKKTERGKRKTGLHLNLEDLEPHFGKKLEDVAEELRVGRSTIKRACRYYGIHRWPGNEKYKKNPSLFQRESANESARDSQHNMKNTKRILPSDMPLDQNVPQTNTENIEHLTVHPEAEKVIIKAKYEDDTIKFQLCLSSGMDKLVEEVATRLNLKIGSFKLKYMDEDNDEILLTCDADLQLCLKSLTAGGKTCIQLSVQLISKYTTLNLQKKQQQHMVVVSTEERGTMYNPMGDYKADFVKKFKDWRAANYNNDEVIVELSVRCIGKVNAKWFDKLYPLPNQDGNWLNSEHIDGLLSLIVRKSLHWPSVFLLDWTSVDMIFWQDLKNKWEGWKEAKKKGEQWKWYHQGKLIMKYVTGSLPLEGACRWSTTSRVFGVAHVIESHWVAYELHISSQEIVVYDSLSKLMSVPQIKKEFEHMAAMLSSICLDADVWGQRAIENPKEIWTVKSYRHPPNQVNKDDCGVLAIKFVECLATGYPIENIDPRMCVDMRMRYCAELLSKAYIAL